MQTDKIKVLYIAGAPRIGSTIAGNVLGHIPGFFFVSEIINIWRYFLIDNKPCGCGKPVYDCEAWNQILFLAFADGGAGIAQEMDAWYRQNTASRHLYSLLFSSNPQKRLQEYLNNLEKLYHAIQSSRICRVIVDGSKRPLYAALLNTIPSLDVYFVHLIRDPRAVSYSWLRKKKQPQGVDMKIHNPAISALRWIAANLTAEIVKMKFPGRYRLIRYEDLVESPRAAVHSILDLIDEKDASLPFTGERTIDLGVNHAVGGNPNRGRLGNTELKKDEEWTIKMRLVDKMIVSIITWPLLLKYGYLK